MQLASERESGVLAPKILSPAFPPPYRRRLSPRRGKGRSEVRSVTNRSPTPTWARAWCARQSAADPNTLSQYRQTYSTALSPGSPPCGSDFARGSAWWKPQSRHRSPDSHPGLEHFGQRASGHLQDRGQGSGGRAHPSPARGRGQLSKFNTWCGAHHSNLYAPFSSPDHGRVGILPRRNFPRCNLSIV